MVQKLKNWIAFVSNIEDEIIQELDWIGWRQQMSSLPATPWNQAWGKGVCVGGFKSQWMSSALKSEVGTGTGSRGNSRRGDESKRKHQIQEKIEPRESMSKIEINIKLTYDGKDGRTCIIWIMLEKNLHRTYQTF